MARLQGETTLFCSLPDFKRIFEHIKVKLVRFVLEFSPIRVFVVRMAIQTAAQLRFRSDSANAQADLNLRLAHISDGRFPDVAAYIIR